MREILRTCPHNIVTAQCMDCEQTFHGPLGIRFIETPEGPGIEICVCDDASDQAHAIARVPKERVPTIKIEIEKENVS